MHPDVFLHSHWQIYRYCCAIENKNNSNNAKRFLFVSLFPFSAQLLTSEIMYCFFIVIQS